jgi:hypothetical protein
VLTYTSVLGNLFPPFSTLKKGTEISFETLVSIYQTGCHIPEGHEDEWLFYSEVGSNRFLRNVGAYIPDSAASHPTT